MSSIAAAFASGDMASAARAMQDYREARVSQNARTRMEALQKAKENAIVILEDVQMDAPKTKSFTTILSSLNLTGKKALFILLSELLIISFNFVKDCPFLSISS